MILCPHCSTENAPEAPWCSSCGRDLGESVLAAAADIESTAAETAKSEPEPGVSVFPEELFEECGIIFIEEVGEFGLLPPWATRRKKPRVFAWELPGGLLRIAYRYPPLQREKREIFRSLLQRTFSGDYVKAALTRWDEILIAVELPVAHLTAERLDVVCQAFFELEEVRLKELAEDGGLTGHFLELGSGVSAAVAADDEPDRERLTDLFAREGLRIWEQESRHGFRGVLDRYELFGVVNWSFGRLQVVGQMPEVEIDDEGAFTRLLQLNHAAELAACALDHDGVLRFLYHTPTLTDEVPGHLVAQFTALVAGVRSLARR